MTSASSITTSVQDAPASITVIEQETMQTSGARDVRDLLRTVPGLDLTRGKRVSARNTFARNHGGDLKIVPVDAIDRIEVVRGPMSTLYGSDAMGGVINIITRKNTDVWMGSVTTEFGTACWLEPSCPRSRRRMSPAKSVTAVPAAMPATAPGPAPAARA